MNQGSELFKNFLIGTGLFVLFFASLLLGFLFRDGFSFAIAKAPLPFTFPQAPAFHHADYASSSATLFFVGDIMLSRAVERTLKERGDWQYPFRNISSFLQTSDILFGNLEGPISDKGANQGNLYSFRADPRAMEGLVSAGFDVLNIVNNHIWDYGQEAFLDTILRLEENNIAPVGGGANYEEAHAGVIKEVNGIKVAFLGYSDVIPKALGEPISRPALSFFDPVQMQDDISEKKKEADIVVVSFHWGNEYQTAHTAFQELVAHAAIDGGARIVVGHHSHVVQEVEEYHEGVIAYSLGNFIFDQKFSDETMQGLLLKVIVQKEGITDIQKLPVDLTRDYQVHLRP